jgi:hypothetical protein
LRGNLAARFDAFLERLDALHTEEVRLIKQMLSAKVQAFVPEMLASLEDSGLASHASQIDVKLRMRLEKAFQDAVADTCQMLATERETIRSELSSLLDAYALPGKPSVVLGQPLSLTPSLAALSEPAALGFATQLSRMAGRGAGGLDSGGVDLADLIAADFAPILDKLGEEASRVFEEGVANFARQAKALTFGPMDFVIGRVSAALNDTQALEQEETQTGIQAVRQAVLSLRPILEARHGGGH